MKRLMRTGSGVFLACGVLVIIVGCLPVSPPVAPSLLTPADGAVIDEASVSFSWSTVAQATDYILSVSLDPSFPAPSVVFGSSVGAVTRITLEGFATDGTTYYWTVQAANAAGPSSAAPVRSFTTGSSATPPGSGDTTTRTWTLMSEPTRALFNSIWGRSSNRVYAAGYGGVIVHYDGTSWTQVSGPFGETDHFQAIWGISSTDIWAVGSYGAAYHFDGSQWTSVPSPRGVKLTDVWKPTYYGTYATEDSVYGSALLRYSGQDWIPQDIPTTTPLYSIWGTAPNNVFVVGAEGNILHFDGASWSKMPTPTTETLFDVWGFVGGPVFAVGGHGTILRLSGGSWTEVPYPRTSGSPDATLPPLYAIWGTSPTDILVCGDGTSENSGMVHFDGTTWQQRSAPDEACYSMWGASTGEVFLVGFHGIWHSPAP